MELQVRKWYRIMEECASEAGRGATTPLMRSVAAAIIHNPYAGRYEEDLSELIASGESLGAQLGQIAVEGLGGYPVESYGKAAMVGTAGEQEHANACLTTLFGDALRKACGGGRAWIPSNTLRTGLGGIVHVPLAYKDALYVRSHYDTVEVHVPDAPLPHELVVIAVVANRGRLNARCGGLSMEMARKEDGLR